MQKESLDLMNVDYEDVLHLYRGWRKSESALKDKDQELATLKERVRTLQDSHNRFRSQIQALESVKELTINLQHQLTNVQQENQQLVKENEELVALNLRAEELLKEKENNETSQSKVVREVQLEFATMRGRYEEMSKAHKELEALAQHEQAQRMALSTQLQQADGNMDALRHENQQLRQEVSGLELKLEQCDHELLHASEQLASISQEVVNIHATQDALSTAEAEVSVLRGDIARLLRLLEYSPATREFWHHWHDSNGMDFVGTDRASLQQHHHHSASGGSGKLVSSSSSSQRLNSSGNNLLDFTMFRASGPDASAADLSELAISKFDVTPGEFAHLKRVHGTDPFPMTNTLGEEAEYWVPSDAAKLGLGFMQAKFPDSSPAVIMDFLRSMNKIWLRRERRKVKRVKEVLGAQLDDLKRQLHNLKPYKGVIQERQIRRLKSQVQKDRKKTLTGRAKNPLEQSMMDQTTFQDVDFAYPEDGHERRLCKQVQRASKYHNADVTRVSTEKLLEASLSTLQHVSKRHQAGSMNQSMAHRHDEEEGEDDEEYDGTLGHRVNYPSASYLRGAVWIGRNMTLVSEELAETLDTYRAKYLSELALISEDAASTDGHSTVRSTALSAVDYRRVCHRLVLLASSGINHAVTLANKSKNVIRDILQGTAALEPGNAAQLQRLLRTLPIESALTASHAAAASSSSGRSHTPQRHAGTVHSSAGSGLGASSTHGSSPNRSHMRYTSVLDSPLFTSDLARSQTR